MLPHSKKPQPLKGHCFAVACYRRMLHSTIILLLLCTWITLPAPGQVYAAATVSLVATEDTWLKLSNSTANYGGATTLQAHAQTSARQHPLIKWNLTSIPAGATITQASITFYVIDSSYYVYNLYQMKRRWVEGTNNGTAGTGANWLNFDVGPSDKWGASGAIDTITDRYDTNLWDTTENTFTAKGSVTISLNASGIAVLQSWLAAPTSNYGLTIQFPNAPALGADPWIVASSEAAEASQRPTLQITYSLPPAITVAGSLSDFTGNIGMASAEQSYTVSGSDLAEDITISAPPDFEISATSGSGFGATLTLPQSGGVVANTTIYVRFIRSTPGSSSGVLTHTSAGATPVSIPLSGTAGNGPPSVTLLQPADDATGIGYPVLLKVSVNDPDLNDDLTVSFYGRAAGAIPAEESEPYALIGTVNDVVKGDHPGRLWQGLTENVEYEWYVTVSDGNTLTTSPTWSFIAGAPTAANLNYFRASRNPAGVLLRWETASETATAGFNLYRREGDGLFIQINPALIAPQAAGQPFGAAYEYPDTGAEPGATYEYRLDILATSLAVSDSTRLISYPYSISLPLLAR